LPLAYRCWNDERQVITSADLLAAVRQDASIPEDSRRTIEAILLRDDTDEKG